MGNDQSWSFNVPDDVRNRKRFTRPGHAEEGLMTISGDEGLRQLGDRLPLVSARFVIRFQLKRHR